MQSLQVADPLMMVLAFVKILAWALRVFSTPDPSTCCWHPFPTSGFSTRHGHKYMNYTHTHIFENFHPQVLAGGPTCSSVLAASSIYPWHWLREKGLGWTRQLGMSSCSKTSWHCAWISSIAAECDLPKSSPKGAVGKPKGGGAVLLSPSIIFTWQLRWNAWSDSGWCPSSRWQACFPWPPSFDLLKHTRNVEGAKRRLLETVHCFSFENEHESACTW